LPSPLEPCATSVLAFLVTCSSDSSKAAVEDSDSGSGSASERPSKKRQLDESDEQVTKKAKTDVAHGSKGEGKERQGKVLMTTSGEKYIDLGKKKRATVREFKGTVFLDIREYYGADDQEKPGKKGISLTLEQWKALSESASEIDQLFSTLKKK